MSSEKAFQGGETVKLTPQNIEVMSRRLWNHPKDYTASDRLAYIEACLVDMLRAWPTLEEEEAKP